MDDQPIPELELIGSMEGSSEEFKNAALDGAKEYNAHVAPLVHQLGEICMKLGFVANINIQIVADDKMVLVQGGTYLNEKLVKRVSPQIELAALVNKFPHVSVKQLERVVKLQGWLAKVIARIMAGPDVINPVQGPKL